ncbi:hypothetical protein FHS42_001785 [Streptomyces zagrosensis]|uniref:Uncharacterized protein n=1 Tax=Streptomyces zagrosensis TaxID=1042984 RepID=A0A7W9Q7Q7_9ACTN|nr:hypothetical protein [Streptomyces zagrosensis]
MLRGGAGGGGAAGHEVAVVRSTAVHRPHGSEGWSGRRWRASPTQDEQCGTGIPALHRGGYAPSGATVSTGCGRPQASPGPTVGVATGLLSPADRSPGRSEVPRRAPTASPRGARLIASVSPSCRCGAPDEQVRKPRVEAGRSWLARTRGPTTRRASRSRAVRVTARHAGRSNDSAQGSELPGKRLITTGARRRTGLWAQGGQTRPRHSSRSVIASAVPGWPS